MGTVIDAASVGQDTMLPTDLPRAYRLPDGGSRGPVATSPPRVLFLEVTNRCNLACRTCVRTYSRLDLATLDLDAFLRTVEQFPALERAVLHGVGEPLLNQCLPEMIAHLKSRGVSVLFNTNATLLDGRWSHRLIATGLDELRVSIDAASAGAYRRARGRALFEVVVANVERLRRLQRESGATSPRVSLWLVATREGIAELPGLVRLAARIGVGEVYLQRLVYPLAGSWGDLDGERPSPDAAEAAIDEATSLARSLGVRLAASGATSPRSSLELAAAESRPWSGCVRPWTTAYVTATGECYACCMVPFADDGGSPLGRLSESDFAEIWNAEPYRRWRSALLSADPLPPCAGCGVHWSL